MPVEEALHISRQILEALEAAHERGICHRDLKPANIKLTADGSVKVLDFGLAKFLQTPGMALNLTHSPTLSLAGTYPGLILGTAGYMSPEQAKGFEADQRSDIFSFGCILYELLTGRQAFEGETASEILASVLKSDVDWNALPPRLNPRLVELLRRCLEKNPKKRWHAAADVRVELEAIAGRSVIVEEPATSVERARPLWKRALAAAAFVVVGAAIAGYAAWTLKPPPPSQVTRFTVQFPESQSLSSQGRQALALSPDGSQLVYTANGRLFVRSLSSLELRPLAGSDLPGGVINPVFSPDGQSVAFRSNADGTLKRLALSGGAPVTISPDGRWIAYGSRSALAAGANVNVTYVEPFPPTAAKYQVPVPGGHPIWTPKGDGLVINSTPVLSQSIPVTTSPGFSFGQPSDFSRRGRTEANPVIARRQVDMMPDGRVIGILTQGGEQLATAVEIVVVLNWLNEVRQRVPRSPSE